MEYASGLKVQRIFTKFGALRDVLDADTGERFWGIGGADAFGNVTRQDYGNGVVGEYAYDLISGRPVVSDAPFNSGSVLQRGATGKFRVRRSESFLSARAARTGMYLRDSLCHEHQ